ncbi:glycine oxidase maturase GoxB [Shimia sp.]|uniref:glycine oxidase maturase GoxB n=1 Tax=Shimia sp. TaxID=1954381 RepID=UPI003B8C0D7F
MIHPVAVIGGGISGAAAALRLAQGGRAPLWIAPDLQGAFKPGEHLGPAATPLLKTLGSDAMLRAEVHRHAHSTYSAWGSDVLLERNAIVHLEGPPTVLDRAAFEQALTEAAVLAGAERISQPVSKVQVCDGHWRLQVGSQSLDAGFLIDATGRKALIGSKYATRFQADKLCCQYALFDRPDRSPLRPVTLIESVPNGWWYLSVLADQRVVVNFYTDADLPGFDPAEFEAHVFQTNAIAAFLSDNALQIATPATRLTTNSSWIAPAIGAGWAAIGDASAAFDPLSSHGMTTALWSAIEVSDAYVAQDRKRMQAYADSVSKGVHDYLRARERVYAQEARWCESPFWARRLKSIDDLGPPIASQASERDPECLT